MYPLDVPRALCLFFVLLSLALPAQADAPVEESAAGSRLFIVSFPRGTVLIDGRDTGLLTPQTKLAVTPGAHTVELRWDEENLSERREIIAEEGKATHLYFRRAHDERSSERCETGDEEACFTLVIMAIERGDGPGAIESAEAYLARYPKGKHAKVAEGIVDAKETLEAFAVRQAQRELGYLVLGVVASALFVMLVVRRRRRRAIATPPT